MTFTKDQVLTNPKKISAGVFATSIEVSYVHFGEKRLFVNTKQGLVIALRYNAKRKKFLADIEEDLKAFVDVPGDDVPTELDDPITP